MNYALQQGFGEPLHTGMGCLSGRDSHSIDDVRKLTLIAFSNLPSAKMEHKYEGRQDFCRPSSKLTAES